MQEIGFITELFRYPVKSMRGERCPELGLDQRGVLLDRVFAVKDKGGKIGSGKNTRRFRRMDGLIELGAQYDEQGVTIRFTDGTFMRAADPDIHKKLSETLGEDVTLEKERDVSHLDAGPLHIITTNQLQELRNVLPPADIATARFRPNIVLGLYENISLEPGFIGRRVRLGGAVEIEISEATTRCRMVSFQQGALPDRPEILRQLAENCSLSFGVYARPLITGSVKIGDKVLLLD